MEDVDELLDCDGRTPPGVRELKLDKQKGWKALQGRTPPGVRELKPKVQRAVDASKASHPSRGA